MLTVTFSPLFMMLRSFHDTSTSRWLMPRKPPTPTITPATLPPPSRKIASISPIVSLFWFWMLRPISLRVSADTPTSIFAWFCMVCAGAAGGVCGAVCA
jgi:hypothetical protein